MSPIRVCTRITACALFALIANVDAQTLYKLIDKDGKVTYSEKPPKDYDGKVIRLDIDPKANTATLPKAAPAEQGEARRAAQKAGDERTAAAQKKLDSAREALKQARENPGESDVARVGKKGGGTRPVATEDYQQRVRDLEAQVKEAEEELAKARRGG